jgi:tRNA(adenine34) deaminase
MAKHQLGRREFVGAIAASGAIGAVLGVSSLASAAASNPAPFRGLDHERFMRAAIAQARKVPQLPFGAVIIRGATGESIATGHNRTRENPTFHGEMDAINRCAAAYHGINWSELVLYTTAEPCPMCQSAIEWVGIAMTVYGTAIPFLRQLGWWQIDIRAAEVVSRTRFRRTALLGGILEQECNALFFNAHFRVGCVGRRVSRKRTQAYVE